MMSHGADAAAGGGRHKRRIGPRRSLALLHARVGGPLGVHWTTIVDASVYSGLSMQGAQ